MLNVAFRICNDLNQAEDLLQDSFVKAFKNLRSYKGTASFGSWLKRIVINTCLNHVKAQKLEFEELREDTKLPVDEPTDFNSHELEVEQIKKGIAKLPTGYRLVISLYLLEGYDHNEIAEVLNISVSTSKSQYSRAKIKLKQNLSAPHQENSTGYAG